MEKLFVCIGFLHFHTGVRTESFCGESKNMTGVEGGEVTLQVDHTEFNDAIWVNQSNLSSIAKTKPGKVIEDIKGSYKGRLRATSNGSLVITNLTREDQGSYKANIWLSKQCTQMYYLTVYDVAPESFCGESRNVAGVDGEEVTLQVDLTEINDITWVTRNNLDPIAKTKPGNVIEDIISSYRGRLNATSNGSLVITNLTRDDQGSYIANIKRSSQCTQEYNLTVYDKPQNSTSNSSTTSTSDGSSSVSTVVK
ncbi:SLAM family member 9-like [Phyllobates terribilis]|uniref:SLAM family member 9-like n=1 Tax=Phyllobates terribilis TaxID=111132 RepID=UPI003CCA7ED7